MSICQFEVSKVYFSHRKKNLVLPNNKYEFNGLKEDPNVCKFYYFGCLLLS